MNIQSSNINFQAKYLFDDKVLKYDKKEKRFLPSNVYFIEIEPNNKNDINSINTLRENWGNAKFIKIICSTLNWINIKKAQRTKIYALTEQFDKYDKLNPSQILCLAHVTERSHRNMILEYLQINPKAINVNNREKINYKGSGTAFLQSLKKIYNKIVLQTVEKENIHKFYRKNGFRRSIFSYDTFIWNCNILTYLKRLFI